MIYVLVGLNIVLSIIIYNLYKTIQKNQNQSIKNYISIRDLSRLNKLYLGKVQIQDMIRYLEQQTETYHKRNKE